MTSVSYEIPQNNTALVLSFFDPSVDNFPTFVQMLQARGYQVAGNHTVDLATLRNMPTNLGVCYIFTHGLDVLNPATAQNPNPTQAQFGLVTSQLVGNTSNLSAADAAALQADVKAGRLIPTTPDQFSRQGDQITTTTSPQVFFATKAFFDFYWKGKQIFAQNSLVFINGCYSADSDFQAMLGGCGAGLVLGWDSPTNVLDAASTAAFVFDRMLGTNVQTTFFNCDLKPQRPMNWDQVSSNMPLFNSLAGNPLGTSPMTLDGITFTSNFSALTEAAVMLVPSIVALGPIEYKQQLTVNGNFGSVQGTVMLLETLSSSANGSPMEIQSWTPQMITCTLPPAGGGTSEQAGGYVLVSLDQRTSNCVPLTVFSGQAIITLTGSGTLQETITENCYLRLDGHPKRADYTQKTSPACYLQNAYTAVLSAGSTLNYQASGEYQGTGNDTSTQKLSGGSTIPPLASVVNAQATSPSQYFEFMLSFTPTFDNLINETHTATVFPTFSQPVIDNATVVLTSTDSDGNSSTSNIPAFNTACSFGIVSVTPNGPISSYDLPDPQSKLPNQGGTLNTGLLSVQLQVQYPPDSSKGEDYLPVMNTSG